MTFYDENHIAFQERFESRDRDRSLGVREQALELPSRPGELESTDGLDHDNELAAMLPPGRQVPAKTRAFLDFVTERLSSEPWWRTPR